MIAINPKADIFFGNKRISILLTRKIIEIEDTDDHLMVSFLQRLYFNSYHDVESLINELEKFSDKDVLRNAIKELEKMNLFLKQKVFLKNKEIYVTPYAPFNFYQNIWGARSRQKIFFFIALNQKEAIDKVKEMALSWIDEAEADTIVNLLEGKIKCLPARINIPKVELIKVNGNCVFVYDSLNGKHKIYRRKFSKMVKDFNFWGSLNKRATGEIGIVPVVKKVLNKDGPFQLNAHTFLSCHKLSSLRDKNEDWQIGRDEELKIAKGKSIMEGIERYCGRKRLNQKKLVYASMQDLGINNCLNPSEVASYSELQFEKGWLKGIVPFNSKIKTNWVELKNFKKNGSKFIPECFVTYAGKYLYPRKIPRLFFTTSNGMAAHTNLDKAIENGVLEIIERDAILIHWINRISPNRIVLPNKYQNFFSNTAEKFKSVGYQLAFLDLTLDTVPVIMSIAYKNDGGLSFFCGAAAAKSKIEAIRKSIEELEFTLWAKLKDLSNLKKEIEDLKIKSIQKPSEHEAIYLKANVGRHLEFLYKGKEIKLSEMELNFKTDIFTAVENTGKEIYYIDLTTEEIQNLNLGIAVVRCIMPGFVPITFGYGYEPLAMRRIYNIPLKMGIIKKSLSEKNVVENYLPHFFP